MIQLLTLPYEIHPPVDIVKPWLADLHLVLEPFLRYMGCFYGGSSHFNCFYHGNGTSLPVALEFLPTGEIWAVQDPTPGVPRALSPWLGDGLGRGNLVV